MKKKTTKKPTTALARKASRAPQKPTKPAPRVTRAAPPPIVAPAEPAPLQQRTLTGDAVELGQLGLVELKTTPEEEAVLSAPVNIDKLRVKPNGAVYEPHGVLTERLNLAFGRFGWVLVVAGHPQKVVGANNKVQVVCPYRLYVHGKEVAFAWGEQDYHDKNAEQSYGDALEATGASALRRCCKHIGIARELWDKSYTEAYLREHCVRVEIKPKQQGDPVKRQWRRKVDPPLPFEIRDSAKTVGGQRAAAPPAVAPAGTHPKATEPITDAQRRRLFTILGTSGRTEGELRDYLVKTHKVGSTKEITRELYDTVVQWIEHPTPPPAPVSADVIDWGAFSISDVDPREPGEEG